MILCTTARKHGLHSNITQNIVRFQGNIQFLRLRLVDNDTIKIQKESDHADSYILENIVK